MDGGEVVAWPAALLLGFRHVLDAADGLAGDEHPLRLGGSEPARPCRETDQNCQEDGQTRCLRLHVSRLQRN